MITVGVKDGAEKAAKPRSTLKSRAFARAFVCLVVSGAVALHSPAALAEDDLDAVCGKTLSAGPSAPSQKLQYCQAAESAHHAANADSAMWKVWAAVGVVCTYACVASFMGGPTSEFICMGVSVAGGVTDAIITKNYTSALMAVAGAGAGYAINQAVNGSKEVAKDGAKEGAQAGAKEAPKKSEKDIGACVNAGMATFQAFSKHKSMEGEDEAEKSNIESAKKFADSKGPAATDGAGGYQAQQMAAASGSGGSAGGNGSSGGGGPSGSNGPASDTKSTCAGARAGASAGVIMQCAIESDRNLPGFVTNPKFEKEFQKRSGTSLDGFLGKNENPSQMMAAASSNGMSLDQGGKLSAAMNDLNSQVGPASNGDSGNGQYAGGGGGSGPAGGSEEDPMGAMMKGLMDQMNPNKKPEEKKSGVSAVIFANQTRSPAAVTEDKTLSIFDRITYRYYFVGKRIVFGEDAR